MTKEEETVRSTVESPEVQAQRAFGVWCQIRAICAMSPRQIGSLLLQAYNDWANDGAARLGAALAYYTLFSVAPILVVVTGIVGLFIGHAAARGEISPWLERLLSAEGARAAELMLQQSASPGGGVVTTIGGLVTLFLGTSALVNELRQSLNLVWRVRGDPSEGMSFVAAVQSMLSDRLYAFLVVIGAGFVVALSLIVNTAVAAMGLYFDTWLPLPEALLQIINFVVSFALITMMFTLLYESLPDADVAWGDACVGAVVTAFLFNAGGMLLSLFFGKFAVSVYGTAASVLALLVWVYYSAQVFFFGAELTRIFAAEYGGGIIPRHRSLGRLLRRS
jgi:membrane protein